GRADRTAETERALELGTWFDWRGAGWGGRLFHFWLADWTRILRRGVARSAVGSGRGLAGAGQFNRVCPGVRRVGIRPGGVFGMGAVSVHQGSELRIFPGALF